MFVQTQLEVHTHQREVITGSFKMEVEWGVSIGGLVDSPEGLGVSENVFGTHESHHGPFHAHNGDLGRKSRRCSF